MKWTYAVTTCLRRLNTLLPRTLASLATGGFERPRVFADDVSHEEAASLERRLGLPVTSRHPALLTSGHWILTLYELLIRDHTADRYATLLSARPLVEKAIAAEERTRIKRIDGGIVNAMNLCGWSEYVHDPSLVQHTGVISTIDNQPHPEATSFKGEDYDLLTLLSPPPSIVPGRKIG
jgi:hypothetical protein